MLMEKKNSTMNKQLIQYKLSLLQLVPMYDPLAFLDIALFICIAPSQHHNNNMQKNWWTGETYPRA